MTAKTKRYVNSLLDEGVKKQADFLFKDKTKESVLARGEISEVGFEVGENLEHIQIQVKKIPKINLIGKRVKVVEE